MIFRVLHTTTYSYSESVSISFHEAVLTPRPTVRQTVLKAGLAVEPKVQNLTARQDYFDMTFGIRVRAWRSLVVSVGAFKPINEDDGVRARGFSPVGSIEATF